MAGWKSSLAIENYYFISHKPTGNKSEGQVLEIPLLAGGTWDNYNKTDFNTYR